MPDANDKAALKDTQWLQRLAILYGQPVARMQQEIDASANEATEARLAQPTTTIYQSPFLRRVGALSLQAIQELDNNYTLLLSTGLALCKEQSTFQAIGIWSRERADLLWLDCTPQGQLRPDDIYDLVGAQTLGKILGAFTQDLPADCKPLELDRFSVKQVRLTLADDTLWSSQVALSNTSPWEIGADFVVQDVHLYVGLLWDNGKAINYAYTAGGALVLPDGSRLLISVSLPEASFLARLDPSGPNPRIRSFFTSMHIPGDFWPDMQLNSLTLAYEPAQQHKLFEAALSGNWEIIDGIALARARLRLEAGGARKDLTFESTLIFLDRTADAVEVSLEAAWHEEEDSRTLQFRGAAAPYAPIPIGALIDDLLARTGLGLELPDALYDLSVSDLEVELEVVEQTISDQDGQSASETRKRLSVGFTVGSSAGDWEVFPGLLSLQPARVSLSLGGGGVQVYIREAATVLGVLWMAEVQLPALRGSLEMVGDGYKLSEMLDFFHLPADGMEAAQLSAASMAFDAQARMAALHLELNDPWELGSFKLMDVRIDLAYQGGQGGGTTARLAAAAEIRRDTKASISLYVSAEHSGPGMGWQIAGSLSTGPDDALSLKDALGSFGLSNKELGPVAAFLDLSLSSLSIDYDTRAGHLAANCALGLTDEAHLTLQIERTRQPNGGHSVHFSGSLLVRTLQFDLIFDKSSNGSQVVGVYQNIGGGPNLIKELAGALVDSPPEFLTSLNFQVKSALLAYKNEAYQNKPGAVADKKKAGLLLAADMDAGIDLSGLGTLPLVGKAFSGDAALRISFTPAYASKEWSADDLSRLRGALPTGAPALPAGPLAASALSLTTSIKIPGIDPRSLDLALTEAEKPEKNPSLGTVVPATSNGKPAPPGIAPPAPPAHVTWVDVNKSLAGIVHLHRVGVGYDDGDLILMLDAAISIAGLSLGLYGLGASYNLSSHELKFMLQGLGLDLSRPPLIISSAFMNFNGDFVGRAVLQMEQFGLTALGAFTTKLGPPSMFIYGFLNYPIGGPVFFFVEGLAAGFGFNRSLTLPDVSVIDQFPLVREAVESSSGGKAPAGPTQMASAQDIQARVEAELIQLATYIAPSIGEYWLAVGIKFNSFRLIDVFALLAISFNANTYRLLISLLGVATIRIPPESPEVLANLQLNIKVTIDPIEGTLLAQAEINRSSWILSPDCHLQGGFAAGLWFLGEHAGDFVYTFGGYHPDFPVPAHYPQVPRLDLSWNISSGMSVKGSLYYAITPNVLMAGGSMAATWKSGDLSAAFSLAADFLIQFKPFHYDARASVEISVSYEEAGLTLSGSVSARLHLWGPDFSGSAHFSCGSVHFAVDFGGASEHPPRPISWAEFKKSFLPPPDGPSAKPLTTVTVTGGLKATNKIRFADLLGPLMKAMVGASLSAPATPTAEVEVAVIDPAAFALQTSTAIPVTTFLLGRQMHSATDGGKSEAHPLSSNFGVAPMNQTTPVSSIFQLTVELLADRDIVDVTEEFTIKPLMKKFPAGLWGKGFQQAKSSRTVDAPGGMTITPNEPALPGGTSSIARSHLDYEPYHGKLRRQADPGKTYAAFGRRSAETMRQDRGHLREQLATGVDARAAALAALPPDLLRQLDLDSTRDIRLGSELADTFIVPPQVA